MITTGIGAALAYGPDVVDLPRRHGQAYAGTAFGVSPIGSALDTSGTDIKDWFTRKTREQARHNQNEWDVDRAEVAVHFSGGKLDHKLRKPLAQPHH